MIRERMERGPRAPLSLSASCPKRPIATIDFRPAANAAEDLTAWPGQTRRGPGHPVRGDPLRSHVRVWMSNTSTTDSTANTSTTGLDVQHQYDGNDVQHQYDGSTSNTSTTGLDVQHQYTRGRRRTAVKNAGRRPRV